MEILKFKSQLFIALGQASAHLRRAQSALTRREWSVAGRLRALQESLRSSKGGLRRGLESFRDAFIVVGHRIGEFSGKLCKGFAQATRYLGQAERALRRRMSVGVVGGVLSLKQTVRAADNRVRKTVGRSRDALVRMNHGIRTFRSQAVDVLEQEMAPFRRSLSTLKR